jgi:hypothetical protein
VCEENVHTLFSSAKQKIEQKWNMFVLRYFKYLEEFWAVCSGKNENGTALFETAVLAYLLLAGSYT